MIKLKDKLLFRIHESERQIFCSIRKKWLVVTPEELVRQLLLIHLVTVLKYKKNLISVEKEIVVHGIKKRFDLLIYDTDYTAKMLVECKAPNVHLKQDAFDQVSFYNQEIKADYLVITNGQEFACAQINLKSNSYEYLEDLPQIH